jgi:hypothetical protein
MREKQINKYFVEAELGGMKHECTTHHNKIKNIRWLTFQQNCSLSHSATYISNVASSLSYLGSVASSCSIP